MSHLWLGIASVPYFRSAMLQTTQPQRADEERGRNQTRQQGKQHSGHEAGHRNPRAAPQTRRCIALSDSGLCRSSRARVSSDTRAGGSALTEQEQSTECGQARNFSAQHELPEADGNEANRLGGGELFRR